MTVVMGLDSATKKVTMKKGTQVRHVARKTHFGGVFGHYSISFFFFLFCVCVLCVFLSGGLLIRSLQKGERGILCHQNSENEDEQSF